MRHSALRHLELYASKVAPTGLDVHGCALRALCEVAQTPLHMDGLLGQLANALLLPDTVLDRVTAYKESDYLEAQRNGQQRGDCSMYHNRCHLSLFQVQKLKGQFIYHYEAL